MPHTSIFFILSYLFDIIPYKTITWNGQIWSLVEDISTRLIFSSKCLIRSCHLNAWTASSHFILPTTWSNSFMSQITCTCFLKWYPCCHRCHHLCVSSLLLSTANHSLCFYPLTQTSRLSPFKSKLQSIMLSPTNKPDITPPSSCINAECGSYHSLKTKRKKKNTKSNLASVELEIP